MSTGPRRGSNTDPDKLEMIRTGKRKKSITGFKENQNITFAKDGGKYVAVQKEKKFEESGVTKKKKNFVMFESKLGTETETDLLKLGGAKGKARDRVEEKIVVEKKQKEYLDNYQYHETKVLKNSKPDTVVHIRWGEIIGGTEEQITTKKITTQQTEKTNDNLRGKQKPTVSATKTVETTTKIGRRGGAGGPTSSTTTTKKEMTTTTGGGETKTSATRTTTTQQGGETKTTTTRSTRTRK